MNINGLEMYIAILGCNKLDPFSDVNETAEVVTAGERGSRPRLGFGIRFTFNYCTFLILSSAKSFYSKLLRELASWPSGGTAGKRGHGFGSPQVLTLGEWFWYAGFTCGRYFSLGDKKVLHVWHRIHPEC